MLGGREAGMHGHRKGKLVQRPEGAAASEYIPLQWAQTSSGVLEAIVASIGTRN